MTASRDIEMLTDRIRHLYSSHPSQGEERIEALLEKELAEMPLNERSGILNALMHQFEGKHASCSDEVSVDQAILTRIFSFLLGKEVLSADLSSSELLNRLADSLNTIFDSLNQLVGVINRTFLGRQNDLETIRQVIGFHLEGEGHSGSLESYLGQIGKAFLAAQQAFKLSAEKKLQEILAEMDPERISGSVEGTFKFGRSRKADSFELYAEKYKALKNWVESGRFMEELMREFEKNSQKLFLK